MSISEPLSLPSAPQFKTTGWLPRAVVGVSESPFSLAQQVQSHQGRRFEVTVTLPKMLRAQAADWQAFFLKCDGPRRRFLLGDPAAAALRGAGGGTPVVDGAHAALASELNVRGLADAAGVWKAGDFIQVGSGTSQRIHMVLSDVAGTGSPTGEAIVDIWPPLRAALSDGAAITTTNCKGVFRLSGDVAWNIDEALSYGFSFEAVEAL